MVRSVGYLTAFASAKGQESVESGSHGVFTRELTRELKSGRASDILTILRNTRKQVVRHASLHALILSPVGRKDSMMEMKSLLESRGCTGTMTLLDPTVHDVEAAFHDLCEAIKQSSTVVVCCMGGWSRTKDSRYVVGKIGML
jgi:hypothetical protein